MRPSDPRMLNRFPRRDGVYNLLSDAVLVHDRHRNRVVRLDALASEIWMRIDGLTTLRDIAADIAVRWAKPMGEIALQAVAMLGAMNGEGLTYVETQPVPLPYHLTMPLDDQDPQHAAASMRECGWI